MTKIGPIETVSETVFTIECFQPAPPFLDVDGKRRRGRWTTCYAWVYACGKEDSQRLSAGTRARIKILQRNHVGWNAPLGIVTNYKGRLNLHYEGLAYANIVDAFYALSRIRAWKSCTYRCRVMRETVWKEKMVLPGERPAKLGKLPKPFDDTVAALRRPR